MGQTNKMIKFFWAIHGKKLGKNIIKDLIDMGTKLVCNSQKKKNHWE